jgi:hypothetical protein
MSRSTKAPRPPKQTKEEIRPRGSRVDPRADPVTSPPPPMSRPPLSIPPQGRDQPGAARPQTGSGQSQGGSGRPQAGSGRPLPRSGRPLGADQAGIPTRKPAAEDPAARIAELERLLDERTRTDAALRDTSIAQIRRIALLEHDLRLEQIRAGELEERLQEIGVGATRHDQEVDELRRQIDAMRLSVEHAGADKAALEAALAEARAEREQLLQQIESLEARLAQIKGLLG